MNDGVVTWHILQVWGKDENDDWVVKGSWKVGIILT